MPIQVSANEITLIQVNDGQNSKENESKHSILSIVQAHKCVEDSFEVAFEFSHVWGRSRFWIKDWCMCEGQILKMLDVMSSNGE